MPRDPVQHRFVPAYGIRVQPVQRRWCTALSAFRLGVAVAKSPVLANAAVPSCLRYRLSAPACRRPHPECLGVITVKRLYQSVVPLRDMVVRRASFLCFERAAAKSSRRQHASTSDGYVPSGTAGHPSGTFDVPVISVSR